ncbi:MAG TPA: DNA translocase FtsK [Anaerolineae bacterium]|nr:DNA translocase FtsK [Anaerolineae bacterium]
MAKASRSRRKPKKSTSGFDLRTLLRPEAIGISLLVLALLTVLSLIPGQRGDILEWWVRLLKLVAGWGHWLMPLWFAVLGLWLVFVGFGRRPDVDPEQPVGGASLYILVLALLHMLAGRPDPAAVETAGRGGGYLGKAVSDALIWGFAEVGAAIILAALSIVSLLLLLGTSPREMWAACAGAIRQLWARQGHLPRLPSLRRHPLSGAAARPAKNPASSQQAPAIPHQQASFVPRIIGGEQTWELPPIDQILAPAIEIELSAAEIRERVRIIEETLGSFGVPAKVVEVNQGPTITQFGVEPGYVEKRNGDGRTVRSKIKVSKIESLSNDLALALAASPIRIEAPVPGRSIVGIEVPNSDIALVSLRSVLESESFRKIKGPLPICLGQDVAGNAVATDLATMPHLLIAGATGSGKSVCINAIIASLLCTRTPDQVKLLMIDPKMVELVPYNGIPHLQAPVVIEIERVVGVLNWALREMETRYKLFNKARARNLEAFNQQLADKGQRPMPTIVVVIDELADLMMAAGEEVERAICRLAQMARATGIHLVIATQSPRVDVVTGLIKANFPARISFAVTSQVDSRVIIDTAGADKLLGRGDMLFMAPDSSKLQRLQGCYVSDKELTALVRHWRGLRDAQEPLRPEDVRQPSLWEEIDAAEAESVQEDTLLPQAIALVQQQRRASVSMLQRRLRIGYSRAAKLIDLMEQQGIVGPETGGSRPREVLVPEEAQADAEWDEDDELPPL